MATKQFALALAPPIHFPGTLTLPKPPIGGLGGAVAGALMTILVAAGAASEPPDEQTPKRPPENEDPDNKKVVKVREAQIAVEESITAAEIGKVLARLLQHQLVGRANAFQNYEELQEQLGESADFILGPLVNKINAAIRARALQQGNPRSKRTAVAVVRLGSLHS